MHVAGLQNCSFLFPESRKKMESKSQSEGLGGGGLGGGRPRIGFGAKLTQGTRAEVALWSRYDSPVGWERSS